MFEKILVPLDGSNVAEHALIYAEEIAEGFGSEVVLYHTHPDEQKNQENMHNVYLDYVAASLKNSAAKSSSRYKDIKITTKVETGEPSTNICNLVDNNAIGLVIMTAVSVSGLRIGKILGSVTDHVCRIVPIPVLLIRPETTESAKNQKPMINHLLITLDGSELSKLALPVGEELATKLKAKITLFQMARMVRYIDDGYGSIAMMNYAEFDTMEKERVSSEMAKLNTELKTKGLDVDNIVISGNDAAEEIIGASKKVEADMVVMSTHGRSGVKRWVLGNVAERVLRHSEKSLLLVHANAG